MKAVVERWTDYTDAIADGLRQLAATNAIGESLSASDAFAWWVATTHETHERGGQIFIIGNGGSAAMASHMVTDAVALAHLRAYTFNDPTLVTAAANDLSFERVFSLPLERLSRPGDLLIAISGSGNSPNIVCAVEAARRLGVFSVTLSAMRADNRCRALGDLNFYVPLLRFGWAQSAHQVILHYWFDQYLDHHGQGAV